MQQKTLFHILLVITFIFAGLSAFSYLMTALLLPTMQQIYADNPTLLPEQFSVMMQQMLDTPRGFFLGAGLLYVLEVLGAALMWRLRWSGFHCYTLARLLLLLLPAEFLLFFLAVRLRVHPAGERGADGIPAPHQGGPAPDPPLQHVHCGADQLDRMTFFERHER